MPAVSTRGLVCSAAVAASLCLAGPAQAVSISIQEFANSAFDSILNGLAYSTVEGFETKGPEECGPGSSACETGGVIGTSVGSFETLGGTGSGKSVVGSGTNLSLKTAASGNAFGRSNTTPDGAWWLDSNDTRGIDWLVDTGKPFDRIAFVLSDVADVGATLSVRVFDSAAVNSLLGEAMISNQNNGQRSLVLLSFDTEMSGAKIEMRNNRLNDGFGIDDALVGRVAPVPLPAPGLLLLGGLGGLAVLRQRRRVS